MAKPRKQQIEEMLAEDPGDAFLRYGLAMEYVSEGNDAEAVRQFNQLFAVASDYMPSYHQAGQALVRLGRADEARNTLRRGIQIAGQQGNHHAAEEMQGLLDTLD